MPDLRGTARPVPGTIAEFQGSGLVYTPVQAVLCPQEQQDTGSAFLKHTELRKAALPCRLCGSPCDVCIQPASNGCPTLCRDHASS